MESKKMVPMNLFPGQQCRHRHREQAYGHRQDGRRKDRVGQTERVAWKHIHCHVCVCNTDNQWAFAV